MSDVASGSAILAGNPSGDGAVAGNNFVAPAETPNNIQSQAPAPQAGNWYDGIQDADLKGYVQNKGWKDPNELANGYRNLEKLLGSEKIPMPKGADDSEGWGRVYDALGRPKSADEYGITTPDGLSTEFSKAAAGKFHELGLSANQAKALTDWYSNEIGSQSSQMKQQTAQQSEADITSLRSEWGRSFDENVELSRRAAHEFGLDGKLDALENALGTADMMKLLSRMGRGLTEHTFEGGKTTQGFGMTPEAAQNRIAQLRSDADWGKKYISGDKTAQDEMTKLMSIAYPDM
jgi:hypothetical protein